MRTHAGLWQRFELGDRLPQGWGSAQRFVVALGAVEPGALRVFLLRLRSAFPSASCSVAVEQSVRLPGALAVRASPAWDMHERSLLGAVDILRRGGLARLPRNLPPRRWIWAEDVARVLLEPGQETGGLIDIQGPALLDGAAVASALVLRSGGRCGTDWLRQVAVPPDPERDEWDEARWGLRRRL